MAQIQRNRPTATLAQAQAGTDGHRVMTAERVHNAFNRYGLGKRATLASGSSDLNSYTTPGMYAVLSGASNAPGPGNAGYFLVMSYQAPERALQLYFDYLVDSVYFRRLKDTWEPWVEIAHDNNTLGMGQSWSDVTASRSLSVVYANGTGRAIEVVVTLRMPDARGAALYVDGLKTQDIFKETTGDFARHVVSAIVPAGSTYEVIAGGSVEYWTELR